MAEIRRNPATGVGLAAATGGGLFVVFFGLLLVPSPAAQSAAVVGLLLVLLSFLVGGTWLVLRASKRRGVTAVGLPRYGWISTLGIVAVAAIVAFPFLLAASNGQLDISSLAYALIELSVFLGFLCGFVWVGAKVFLVIRAVVEGQRPRPPAPPQQ